MPDQTVRNAKNIIIGWCKEYSDRIIGTHYKKGFVGCYTKGTDTTTDAKGRIYCYGNGISDLIRSADKEN